jgi:hypothetical protein
MTELTFGSHRQGSFRLPQGPPGSSQICLSLQSLPGPVPTFRGARVESDGGYGGTGMGTDQRSSQQGLQCLGTNTPKQGQQLKPHRILRVSGFIRAALLFHVVVGGWGHSRLGTLLGWHIKIGHPWLAGTLAGGGKAGSVVMAGQHVELTRRRRPRRQSFPSSCRATASRLD